MTQKADLFDNLIIEDPEWPTAKSWLRGDLSHNDQANVSSPVFSFLGIPLSQASPPPHGSHFTPVSLREALHSFSPFAAGVGWDTFENYDLTNIVPLDLGDLNSILYYDNVEAQRQIQSEVSERIQSKKLCLPPNFTIFCGGDDGIIRPVFKGCYEDLSRVGLLTLDAHHDVRVYYRNLGPHNGSPVRGLIDDGLKGENIVQVGISTFTNSKTYRSYCDDKGITIIGANEARKRGVGECVTQALEMLSQKCDAILVDFDLDVTELGFGPACGGAKPGGLTPWEVHDAAFAVGSCPKVFGLCIVEVDISRDTVHKSGIYHAAMTMLHAAAGFMKRIQK